jgi:hypothetical protein
VVFPRGSGSPVPATVTGWAGLISSAAAATAKMMMSSLESDGPGCNAGSNAVCSSLLILCLAISAQAIPTPQCDPCKPSCQAGGDNDLVAPVCEDLVQETLLYKSTVVILYSSGVPVMVCLLMAWTFWKATRD